MSLTYFPKSTFQPAAPKSAPSNPWGRLKTSLAERALQFPQNEAMVAAGIFSDVSTYSRCCSELARTKTTT